MTDDEILKLCEEAEDYWRACVWGDDFMAARRAAAARRLPRFIAAARQLVPELLERARKAESLISLDLAASRDQWRAVAQQEADAGAALAERVRLLEQEVAGLSEAAKRAAAELRHGIRFSDGEAYIDPALVDRAVVILEEATTPRSKP